MILILGLLIIAAAVWAVVRKVDVRLALLLAAAALGALTGKLDLIAQKFFATFTSQQFLVPICCAMGFSYALRHTQCDQHLVHLLVEPLRRVRAVLIPGAVLVGFLVNITIVSQTSTAVAIGTVLVPLMLAARLTAVTAGAALLLGASLGGELLNPGAPEFRTVVTEAAKLSIPIESARCVQAVLPLVLLHLIVATTLFWAMSRRAESAAANSLGQGTSAQVSEPVAPEFKVHLFKAAVPIVPIALLFLVSLPEPLRLLDVPKSWLTSANDPIGSFDSRLIGVAMLIGVVVAALTDRKVVLGTVGAFCEGAGYAFTHIISLIVAAACFGEGVAAIGLAEVLHDVITAVPNLLLPAAGLLPLAFAVICGSGFAATQSLYGFFAAPAVGLGVAPEHVGSVVAIGAAAGRTMSLVAAVTLMCASLTKTNPIDLVKRVAVPLLAGVVVVVIAAMLMTAAGWRKLPAPPTSNEVPPAAVR
ncbi:MAG: C4-dicarboxylate transporter DcuC [Verrucomicrobia bacterium]|nr:C4-dicarboxylate transporter DcuC [Verrucomicrobiota bacterium]